MEALLLDVRQLRAELAEARGVVARALAEHHQVLDELEDGYYEVDLRGGALFLNAAFTRMLGYSRQELLQQDYRDRQSLDMTARIQAMFTEVFRTGQPKASQDWEYRHKDGRIVQVEGSVHLMRDTSGVPRGFRGIVRDVTERRRLDAALRESEARFRALTSISSDYYWEQDAQHRIVLSKNRNAETDDSLRAYLGKPIWESGLTRLGEATWDSHRKMLDEHRSFRDLVMVGKLPDGRSFYVSVSGEAMYDAAGTFRGYRGITRDITPQKWAEERARHVAMHDGLTGLPNRRMFMHLLKGAIATAARYRRQFAVLFIDLDRFKFINDTFGHEAGDQLLKVVSTRFKEALRASDVIARLGGDEFVVLTQETADPAQAATVAQKLLSVALQPIELAGRDCRVSASMGIAMYPSDGGDEQTLMRNADIAMYVAKDEGKNTYQLFSNEINARSMERLALEAHLRTALERNEFSLHYQPKLDLRDDTITGVEALLRWHSAELGQVSPVRFIPVAEEIGLIVELGKWVLQTACEQAVAWQREGLAPIGVAVNVSTRQFAEERLVETVVDVLERTGLRPDLLELEITEGMLAQDPARAVELLRAIKAKGVRISIDDFGTGYSSLGQLKNFPVDTLKIDRSFIRDLPGTDADKAIAVAIIALGKTLRLKVVAEGVETMEQQSFLREQACDEMQGYYFSRPIVAEQLAQLLRNHSPADNARRISTIQRKS